VSSFGRFRANIAEAGLSDLVVPLRLRSYEVSWTRPIVLLFVDGLHDYASVARDFRHFEAHLVQGGYVAFHDCDDNYPGVAAFAAGLGADPAYEDAGQASSLRVFRRCAALVQDPVAALRARLAQQEKGIAFLMGEIAARESTVREREEGIEWLRSVIRDKEIAVSELEKGVEWLRKELRERDQLIDALRAERIEK
jgi:hypothetical protein